MLNTDNAHNICKPKLIISIVLLISYHCSYNAYY